MNLKLDNTEEYQETSQSSVTPVTNYDEPNSSQTFSDLEQPVFRTNSTYVPKEPKAKSKVPSSLITIVILAAVIFFAWKFISGFLVSKDITTTAKLPRDSMASSLNETFTENPSYINNLFIPSKDSAGYSVYTNKDNGSGKHLGIIYYNNQQCGIILDSKSYSIFGIKVGDGEAMLISKSEATKTLAADSGIGYPYSTYYEFVPDGGVQVSTSYLFYGTDGSILILKCHNTTHQVVCIEYYYNGDFLKKQLDTF